MVLPIRAKKLVVPQYDSMVDVYDTAFVIRRVTNGILGDYQPPTNVELIELVQTSEQKDEPGLGIPFNYAPAVFNRDMLENDFEKNVHAYEWCPDGRSWELAVGAFSKIIRPYMDARTLVRLFDGSKNSVWLALHEAVKWMDRTTSPGFPLNLKYKEKGPAWDGDKDLLVDLVWQVLSTGKFEVLFEYRPGKFFLWKHVYYQVSPKGELRTVDKLLAEDRKKRKTRTFMCGDLVLYLVTVMLYGPQHESFLTMAEHQQWSAVGMSPWYGGWNRLALYLSSGARDKDADPLFHCFDVSHMEASVNDAIQTVIDKNRNEGLHRRCPGPEYHAVRHGLQWVHDNSVALYVIGVSGWLYLIQGKNPSGKFLTADDNTLALMLGFLYVIARECQSEQQVLAEYYFTPAKLFGDDSIIRDKPWVHNAVRYMREIGFELKYECPVGPLTDARFLNAGFHRGSTTWYFKPNFEKIRASIFFLWKSRSWRLAYVKVCAYRQLVFPYELYRREADRMLSYIVTHHDDCMLGEHSMDSVISYTSARASLMSDADNEFLHSGFEVGDPVPRECVMESRRVGFAAGCNPSVLEVFTVPGE